MKTEHLSTRRQFLATTAIATGAVLVPPDIVPSAVCAADESVVPSKRDPWQLPKV